MQGEHLDPVGESAWATPGMVGTQGRAWSETPAEELRPRGELLFISANWRRPKRRSGGGTSIDLALPLWSPPRPRRF
jgi:hypothetical protein